MPTVLIVDDNQKVIDMLRRTLIYEGYEVLVAMDGPQALLQAQSHRPDVIAPAIMLAVHPSLPVPHSLRRSRYAAAYQSLFDYRPQSVLLASAPFSLEAPPTVPS